MTLQEIDGIIQQGEGLKIEFKEATDSIPKSFYETVVSFSNTDGGTILLGVDDLGNITGITPSSVPKLLKDMVTALNSRDCINPPLYVQPFTVQHSNGLIVVIQIQASSQVHDHAGSVYIREFEADLNITANQHKVGEMYLRKRNFFTETQIYPYLSLADFDDSLFEKARQLIRNFRSDHPWLLVSVEQMLKDSVLWRKDHTTGMEGYTLAAALIFGKESTIQSILPAYKVEAMVRIENKDRWDDRITLRKNLIDTYFELKQFINKHLPEKFYVEGDQRIDLRDKIFREVIGNIIVHREYTSAISTDLIISETEVTLTNPNKPLFHGPINPVSFNPYPKNPNIRKFFTAFGWTDEIGSGVRNTYKYIPLYVSGAKPSFVENEIFTTVIPLQWLTLSMYAQDMLQWFELPSSLLPHLQKGLGTVPLSASLRGKSWSEVLLYLVPSWHKKGTQLPILNWPEYQLYEKELAKKGTQLAIEKVPGLSEKGAKLSDELVIDFQGFISEYFKKVPSSAEKGAKLLAKKSFNLILILTLTSEPIKIEKMMECMHYKKRQSFRELYLVPLQHAELVTKTNPGKGNDPDQQYLITDKGRAFLSNY
jgi:ATP-dependent DNA helicase RecG